MDPFRLSPPGAGGDALQEDQEREELMWMPMEELSEQEELISESTPSCVGPLLQSRLCNAPCNQLCSYSIGNVQPHVVSCNMCTTHGNLPFYHCYHITSSNV